MPVTEILYLSMIFLLAALFLKQSSGLVLSLGQYLRVLAGGALLALLSFFITEQKIGGTVLQVYHGWPHFFYNHQIKDVIDQTLIARWHFMPGPFGSYLLADLVFYCSLSLAVSFLVMLFRQGKATARVVLLAVILAAAASALVMAALPKAREARIQQEIRKANYCRKDSDCVDAGSKCPFGCYAYVNAAEAKRVAGLIAAYESNCVYSCLRCSSASCQDGVCKEVCE